MKTIRYVVEVSQDEDSKRWCASWGPPQGGGVVAEGLTIEQTLTKFRGALAVYLGNKKAAKGALFTIELVGFGAVAGDVAIAVAAKSAVEEQQELASHAISKAALLLKRRGFKPRDIGTLLGVSRQWAHKLLKSA